MNQNQKKPAALEPVKIFSALRAMMNREYIFKGNRIQIGEVSEIAEGYYIMTSLKNYTMTLENANAFIAECFLVESILPQASNPQRPVIVQPSKQDDMIDDMGSSMYEIFQKLKQNPTKEHIEQATAMSNAANTVANLIKLKLQSSKMGGKLKI